MEIGNKDFITLTTFVKENYGINLTEKKTLIEGRLSNYLTQKGYTSFTEYLEKILSGNAPMELTMLINKLTTNHTFFMREGSHFDFFRNNVLPYLEANVRDRDLRIWSAGCSSGEEPYTLAMIISDYFGDEKRYWDKKILATDISVDVLQRAEKGVYSSESLESIPPMWKLSYFNKLSNDTYVVSHSIKDEVIFRVFNLMDREFPFKRKFHVIFCRNVMIYFDKETKARLINKFYDLTEEGGYLFIGHSEAIDRERTGYKYVMPAVYRKG